MCIIAYFHKPLESDHDTEVLSLGLALSTQAQPQGTHLRINILPNKCTSWYYTHDIHKLHASVPRWHLQAVTTIRVYKPTCQYIHFVRYFVKPYSSGCLVVTFRCNFVIVNDLSYGKIAHFVIHAVYLLTVNIFVHLWCKKSLKRAPRCRNM